MQWFRLYHGTCTDAKLHTMARAAGVRRSVVIACWVAILETASEGEPRGTIGSLTGPALGFMVGESEAVGVKVLAQFRERGMILPDGRVANWDKRQRGSDDAADRKRKQRERTKSASVEPGPHLLPKDESGPSAKPLNGKGTVDECHGTIPYRAEEIGLPSSGDSQAKGTSDPLDRAIKPPKSARSALWDEISERIREDAPDTDARALMGRWIAAAGGGEEGEGRVFAAHFGAMRVRPAHYIGWMSKKFLGKAKRGPPSSADIEAEALRILNERERTTDDPEPADSGGPDAASRRYEAAGPLH